MQFPNSPRTRETERLMRLWRHLKPDADTAEYNRTYEQVYAKLTDFSDAEDQPRVFLTSGDPEALAISDGERRFLVITDKPMSSSSKTPPPKWAFAPGCRAPKHRAGTKGAFGKPKHLKKR